MRGKSVNAKYSVSFCLPFLSGTLPPPELFTADFEEELKRLCKELNRQRMKGKWNMRIGSVEQGKRNMKSDARKWLHLLVFTLDF